MSRVPIPIQSPHEVSLGVVGVSLAVMLSSVLRSQDDHPITLLMDANGLAAFTATGAIVAIEAGVSAFGVVAIAIINAVGGGAFADILLDQSPFILFDDFYASCAVLDGSAFWAVARVGAFEGIAAGFCAVVVVVFRLTAVTYDWVSQQFKN